MYDPDAEDINILLLGETGVGKSTFINSFANYMKYENLDDAEGDNFSVLIPTQFHMFDKYFKKHYIQIGSNEDANECLETGASQTQDVKTYVFNISENERSYKLRLIDTPGMGDPRGIKKDNENCEYILSYLGRIKKLHAICLLFNPSNSRVTVFLKYCINQILSRLEKSASRNIVFIFTNTRGHNYTPGETYGCLELVVQEIKEKSGVDIPLSFENAFCFDNEAFRYLAAIRQDLEFKDGIREANIESWRYSYKEVWRMILYIIGDETHSSLTPHDTKHTISVNKARKMILQLTKPLAEIVQLINDNIYNLTQHTAQLLLADQTLEQLKQKLYMPIVDLRVVELEQPVTVCTATKCAQVYEVGGKNKWHYRQRCHNPCYLDDVPKDVVGDPHLINCDAINRLTQRCKRSGCGCRYNVHMHIYYETETFESKIIDSNISNNITTKEEVRREIQKLINRMSDQMKELEMEHEFIVKTTAQFAYFLQHNAITPINDAYKEYVQYLISREETSDPEFQTAQSRETINYLKTLLNEYEEEKKVIQRACQQPHQTIIDFSPEAIQNRINRLYQLKHFGQKIKELYDSQNKAIRKEHSKTEYIVDTSYSIPRYIKEELIKLYNKGKKKLRRRPRNP